MPLFCSHCTPSVLSAFKTLLMSRLPPSAPWASDAGVITVTTHWLPEPILAPF